MLTLLKLKKIREEQLFLILFLIQPATSGKFIFLLSFQMFLAGSLIANSKKALMAGQSEVLTSV